MIISKSTWDLILKNFFIENYSYFILLIIIIFKQNSQFLFIIGITIFLELKNSIYRNKLKIQKTRQKALNFVKILFLLNTISYLREKSRKRKQGSREIENESSMEFLLHGSVLYPLSINHASLSYNIYTYTYTTLVPQGHLPSSRN